MKAILSGMFSHISSQEDTDGYSLRAMCLCCRDEINVYAWYNIVLDLIFQIWHDFYSYCFDCYLRFEDIGNLNVEWKILCMVSLFLKLHMNNVLFLLLKNIYIYIIVLLLLLKK
jgi:hypothetical protein